MRQHAIAVLQHSELYADKVKDMGGLIESPFQCTSCNTIVTFIDNDLLLGSKPHNRPSFVISYIREQKVKRIPVDGGSAINIIPKSTMNDLGIIVKKLSNRRTMIQGFNLEAQHAIGMIHIELIIGDLSTSSIFHVIDVKISYSLLLGRPWLHEHVIVTSTLH